MFEAFEAISEGNGASRESWDGVVEALLAGDRRAQLRLARLVTGFLAHWRAYDFRDDWADIVQEVLLGLIRAAREGRLAGPETLIAWVRATTHHKYVDRLRAHLRRNEAADAPLDDESERAFPALCHSGRQDVVADVRFALDRLPERTRRVVYAVYGENRTYEQVARDTGIPLGSVKRYLREGMAALRRDFGA